MEKKNVFAMIAAASLVAGGAVAAPSLADACHGGSCRQERDYECRGDARQAYNDRVAEARRERDDAYQEARDEYDDELDRCDSSADRRAAREDYRDAIRDADRQFKSAKREALEEYRDATEDCD